MSRVGIYGGSFNPPHVGHVLAAREMIKRLQLDRLCVIPAAIPPHKTLAAGSPTAEERLRLCKLAFADVEKAEVLDLELRREGPSYTVDTLRELRAAAPEDELLLLMGTDMLLSFDQWREPEQIAALAELAVMHRDERADTWTQVREKAEALQKHFGARVRMVENRCIQISSTTVRRLLAFRAPGDLPPAVEEEILKHGWYLSGADFHNLPYEELERVSLSLHDEKRRAHVLGCAETAETLAVRWGEDPGLARRAGILHDITKALDGRQQLHLCEKYDIMLTSLQRSHPKLLHAKTGAAIARHVFGECAAVCDAIEWHTTGKGGMNTLEKLLYIADYMEPNRRFPGVEKLRSLVWEDLDAAMRLGLEITMEHLRRQGSVVDPDSRSAWESFNQKHTSSDLSIHSSRGEKHNETL